MPGIEPGEYADRRRRVLGALDGATGVVFAGQGEPMLRGSWAPSAEFRYLTGIRDEPGSAVLFDPGNDDPRRRIVLFLRPLDPERERWDGYRDEIGSALRARYGFETVMRAGALPRALTLAARRCGRLACLHPPAVYDAPVSPDLGVFRRVAERLPEARIIDRTDLLASMRAVKSEGELGLMGRAIEATAAGHAAAGRAIHPGGSERDVLHALVRAFVDAGAQDVAYTPIVGSGRNGTVLHYSSNDGPLRAGDLVVIDAGAEFQGYAADVTRTYPVSGRFAPEQREVYELVLRSQAAGIEAVRPGATLADIDAAARAVIDAGGLGDAFIHGIGHHLGLEVHDAAPEGPLRPGMVLTIEPGVYLPQRNLGVRIEDEVLVTESGARVLTGSIPKEPGEVERMVGAGR
jgi:Xaa-Pro aminopeptidase